MKDQITIIHYHSVHVESYACEYNLETEVKAVVIPSTFICISD